MHTRYVDGLTIRPLRNGDADTVAALFARLGDRSRERRFCGAKPRLGENELVKLARVDGDHHVLVGYVDGDAHPAGIARLVRDGAAAEIAFAVADEYQGRGIGSVLAGELAADARAAGITELIATVCGDNPSVVAVLERLGSRLDVSWQAGSASSSSVSRRRASSVMIARREADDGRREARTQGAPISIKYGRDRGRSLVAPSAASRHGRSLR